MDKIKLNNAKIIFANLKDDGYGKSITIDATSPEVQKQITEWVEVNKIGKTEPGVPKFKEYQPEQGDKVIQYSFRINDYTKFVGINGLTKEDLGYGAEVSLIAQAFEYNNKFGKGVSASLSAVLIEKAVRTSADDDIDDLLQGAGVDPNEAKSGYAEAKEKWGKQTVDEAPLPEPQGEVQTASITDEGEVNLDDIPF